MGFKLVGDDGFIVSFKPNPESYYWLVNNIKLNGVSNAYAMPCALGDVVGVAIMGHIRVKATFYNAVDYTRWVSGEVSKSSVRRVESEVLIDTGVTYPALPADAVEKLGLNFLKEVNGEVANGKAKPKLYGLAIIEIEDRVAGSPVIWRPKGTTPIIGVIALEQKGFRADPATGKLVKVVPLML